MSWNELWFFEGAGCRVEAGTSSSNGDNDLKLKVEGLHGGVFASMGSALALTIVVVWSLGMSGIRDCCCTELSMNPGAPLYKLAGKRSHLFLKRWHCLRYFDILCCVIVWRIKLTVWRNAILTWSRLNRGACMCAESQCAILALRCLTAQEDEFL